MIYVMRHGESVVNTGRVLSCRKLDGDLTEKGRTQARLAGEWLASKNIVHIHASPFHRTRQTAAIIAALIGGAVEVNDDLREMDCGDLEGRIDEDAWDEWMAVARRWRGGEWQAGFRGGENLRTAHDRFKRALTGLPAENTLLVTHGGITTHVIPYLCVNAAALQRVNYLDYTGFIVLEPYDAERFICESWNRVEHLPN